MAGMVKTVFVQLKKPLNIILDFSKAVQIRSTVDAGRSAVIVINVSIFDIPMPFGPGRRCAEKGYASSAGGFDYLVMITSTYSDGTTKPSGPSMLNSAANVRRSSSNALPESPSAMKAL